MSNTPRTDSLIHAPGGNYFSASATDFRNLCFELERENTRLRDLLKDCREEIEGLDHGAEREKLAADISRQLTAHIMNAIKARDLRNGYPQNTKSSRGTAQP